MFRFENPIYLWLLIIIPLLAMMKLWSDMRRSRRLKRFGDKDLLLQLSPTRSAARFNLKFWLLQAALALMIIMVARPQMGSKVSTQKREGIETIIALDISNSMMAQDVAPSRLEKSKLMVENLIEKFNNDKIGLIVFAGDAFVQLPITSDYVSAEMFLDNIDPSLIGSQGTDIARAINLSMQSFTQDAATGKAIIIITDGEDHEGGAEQAAAAAQKKGINVFVLGIGSDQGAPIPDSKGGYMKDAEGETVISRLNEDMCRKVAAAGKGTYIHVDNSTAAELRLNTEIARLQKGDITSTVYSDYNEQFQAFALLIIVLLIADILISEARREKKINKTQKDK